MKKVIALSTVLGLGALGMACGEAPANNTTNKPANNSVVANNTMTVATPVSTPMATNGNAVVSNTTTTTTSNGNTTVSNSTTTTKPANSTTTTASPSPTKKP